MKKCVLLLAVVQDLHRRCELLKRDPFRGPRQDQILMAGGFIEDRAADSVWKTGGTDPEKLLHGGRTAQVRVFMNTDADEAELARRVALLNKSPAREGIDAMLVVVSDGKGRREHERGKLKVTRREVVERYENGQLVERGGRVEESADGELAAEFAEVFRR